MRIFRFKTLTPSQTISLGDFLLKNISPGKKASCGSCANIYIKLIGDLGTGKTTFASGFVKGARKSSVSSPSFNLLKIYRLPGKKILYHLDLYRLKKHTPILELFEPVKGNGIWLIEWADKLPTDIFHDDKTIEVRFSISDAGRLVTIKSPVGLLNEDALGRFLKFIPRKNFNFKKTILL